MSSALTNEAVAPRPLTVIESSEFEPWLSEQPTSTQDWLKSIDYQGKGLALIPMEADEPLTLYAVSSLKDPFAAGELANILPAATYQLTGDFADDTLTQFAFGWACGSYRFNRYLNKDDKPGQSQATLYMDNDTAFTQASRLAEATRRVRDLINTPASDLLPEQLSDAVKGLADEFGASFSEIVGEELISENYPMIHAVGRASTSEPRLLDLRWGEPAAPKITLVGKGVCFDSGGLNIKTGNYMRQMKKDMGGSAHVLGLAYLIMANELPVNLRVLIPAVENAISGNAFRPGDILPTRKGLTVEIDNTDAEGRLVLCDALAEASSENPDIILDFATLTGACRVALGTELPGFFSNNKDIAQKLMAAGEAVSEPVWQLPLHKPYFDFMKSDIADLVNGASTPYGGAITAALYLEAFVDNTPWVHFDIMAWNNRKLPGRPVGGEAMGMRATYAYLEERYGN